jgi:hypothetical protein
MRHRRANNAVAADWRVLFMEWQSLSATAEQHRYAAQFLMKVKLESYLLDKRLFPS